jgi:hypothetical protein
VDYDALYWSIPGVLPEVQVGLMEDIGNALKVTTKLNVLANVLASIPVGCPVLGLTR